MPERPTRTLIRVGEDPFQHIHGKPLGGAEPGSRYLGRVVVEAWQPPASPTDTALALVVDAAEGTKKEELLRRIAAVFPREAASVSGRNVV